LRIFVLSMIVAIGMATFAGVVLRGHHQESAEDAFASSTARP